MSYKQKSPIIVQEGGTGAQTFTSHGVLLGNTTSAITATAAGTTGQVLTGVTGNAPTFQSPAASSISITGDSGGTLTGAAFTFTGGTTGLTFAGAISTETLGGTLIVSNGGTGAATLTGVLTGNGTSAVTANAVTQYGTVIAGASNAVSSVAPSATSGVPYISQGSSSNPTFGTAVVAGGGTGNTTFTAYSVITAGTTATGTFQNVSGVGSSGQTLTSNGASALPTWQNGPAGVTTWNVVTGTTQALVKNNGYFANHAGTITFTLPSTAAIGDTFEVAQMQTGQTFVVNYNSGQKIYIGTTSTTTTSGSLTSTADGDWVQIVCRVASTDFQANIKSGNLTPA